MGEVSFQRQICRTATQAKTQPADDLVIDVVKKREEENQFHLRVLLLLLQFFFHETTLMPFLEISSAVKQPVS